MGDIVTIDGIPVYQVQINGEDDGMTKISLVDYPAVMTDFVAFKADKPKQLYKISDEAQRRVLGVVMRADFPIYRRDEALKGEYYIIFKADTIKQMAEKYLFDGLQNEVNLNHEEDSDVDGVNMVQFFIKGNGINPEGFEDIADGSLFAEFHVTNDDVWEAIQAGTYKGFSLEGYYSFTPETNVEEIEEIVEGLDGKFAQMFKDYKDIFKLTDMSRIKAFITALGAALAAVPEPEKPALQLASTSTDNGVLFWEGDEDLKAGDSVFVEDSEGNRNPAPDGDYVTEDGKTIVVVDGKVSEIKDPAAEVAPEESEETNNEEGATTESLTPAQLHRIMCTKLGMSFDEKYNAIYDALHALGYEYPWVTEAGDDYAVVEMYISDHYEHKRFPVTFNEDGTATLGAPVNVKRIYVPVDFADPFETANELSRVKDELETLKKTPAGQPAHTTFKTASETPAAPQGLKGQAGLNRLSRIVNAGK